MIQHIREQVGISFADLERELLRMMSEWVGAALVQCLKAIEEQILAVRDPKRYQVKHSAARTVETLLGTHVTFQRRYYRDRETGKYVFLLDEVLGLPPHQQLSPALVECMMLQGVSGPSYRAAAKSLEQVWGRPVTSHESVRQVVLEAGSALMEEEQRVLKDPQGKRRVPVLFLEVDGLHHSLQQDAKRSIEERVLTIHEGWEPRHPSSVEYRLRHVKQFRTQGEDFWEEASRFVYSLYDIDEKTLVVINGDRAAWIRQGVECFPNALYQVDRFHLKKELRRLFRKQPATLKTLFDTLDGPDVTGATFLAAVAEAAKQLGAKERTACGRLLKDLSAIPEATVDYRRRMSQRGLSTKGLRGLGAAESQMDRLSDRTKGRGRSWSRKGLSSMMQLLCWRNNGQLANVAERVATLLEQVHLTPSEVRRATTHVARQVLEERPKVRAAGFPATRGGRTATGGLSRYFQGVVSGASA